MKARQGIHPLASSDHTLWVRCRATASQRVLAHQRQTTHPQHPSPRSLAYPPPSPPALPTTPVPRPRRPPWLVSRVVAALERDVPLIAQ